MSNELTLSASIDFAKGKVTLEKGIGGVKIDVSGTDAVHLTQTVGTSEEALNIGDITIPGYALFYNGDADNFVEIRAATGEADLVTVPAGGIALFQFSADCTAPYAIADTASVHLEYWLVEA